MRFWLITREREKNSALNLSNAIVGNDDKDSPSIAELQIFYPPSIAERVRGRVFLDSIAVITSSLDFLDSKLRGTSPQLQSSDLARKREWVQLCKQNLYDNANNVDCHDSSLFDKSLESRNDGNPYWAKYFTNSRNDKSTHPLLSPSAMDGEIIQNNEISTKINPHKYIKLAQIDSIRTDFVQAYLPQKATTSKINSIQKDSPQEAMDSMQVANNTANTQNNAFINNYRDISRYALNMTNDIDFRQATDSAQIDSMQMFFAQNAITSQQTDSMPQAFDKPSRYNKLKKSQETSSQNLQDSQNLQKSENLHKNENLQDSQNLPTNKNLQENKNPQKSEKLQINDLESTNLQAKDLGKIVATGHKTNIDPITQRNIQIINKADLQNKGYTTLQQALETNPNISFYDNGFGQTIDIRGQGEDANRAVKILVNQVPINLLDTSHGVSPYNALNIEDIESIEIIPGGGSVIYGSGTRGGVVNFVTKKPSKDYTRASIKFTTAEAKGLQGGSLNLGIGQAVNKRLFLRGDMAISYVANPRNTSGKSYDYCFPKSNTNADGSCVGTEGYSVEKVLNGKSYSDNAKNIYVAFGANYDISQRQNVDFNVNYTRGYVVRPRERLTLAKIVPSAVDGSVVFFDKEELKDRRYSPDDESIKYTTNALQSSLTYKLNATKNLKFEMLGFFQMSNLVYSDYEWLAKSDGIQGDTKMSQLGSSFANYGGGLNFRLKHIKGFKNLKNTAIVGYDLGLLHSNRTNHATRTYSHGYFLQVHINSVGSKIQNSIYMLDNLQFNKGSTHLKRIFSYQF